MIKFESVCIGIPEILLPKQGIDLTKWAIIACDQFTSEPDYWQKVRDFVGEAPSALHLVYPEVYLNEPNPEERIRNIKNTMHQYIEDGLFEAHNGLVYVERNVGGKTRKGLLVCLDLEHYDYSQGAHSLIRATEGTILERIPPRVKIREGAPLELPHIMVLIDDPGNMVIGPLTEKRNRLTKLYDFELMMASGRLSGYKVQDPVLENEAICGLRALADSTNFSEKYSLPSGTPVLLYAMGDGNHSLATAKAIWEKIKENTPNMSLIMESSLRHALVEIVNLHDDALVFEPIHRIIFGVAQGRSLVKELSRFYPNRVRFLPVSSFLEIKEKVDAQADGTHILGLITPEGFGLLEIRRPEATLPVGSLQNFLDSFMKTRGAHEIDYVHGAETVSNLGRKPGNAGFYLPAMKKRELFRTVILDGSLPRKTFSLGEAREKRFYMEARRLAFPSLI